MENAPANIGLPAGRYIFNKKTIKTVPQKGKRRQIDTANAAEIVLLLSRKALALQDNRHRISWRLRAYKVVAGPQLRLERTQPLFGEKRTISQVECPE